MLLYVSSYYTLGVQAVRLRHRTLPGEPLWVERSYFGQNATQRHAQGEEKREKRKKRRVDASHLLHYLHFANHPHLRFPDAVFPCALPAGI
jgi:hypothetical protein